MRVRRLQYLNEDGIWVNQAYVIEDNQGELSFYYNTLTWGRVGADLAKKIRDSHITLTEIESIMPGNERVRWLPVETPENQNLEQAKTFYDTLCNIPTPQPASTSL